MNINYTTRERLIQAGIIKPRRDEPRVNEPTTARESALPTLRLDEIGKKEAAGQIANPRALTRRARREEREE